MRNLPGGEAVAEWFHLPSMRRPEGLGAVGQEIHLGMRRVRTPNLGDCRNCHAPEQGATLDLVHGGTPGHQHSNGVSALQLQGQLGLGSYKTAWLMLHKLRRAMVDPGRSLLADLVEIDESEIPYRTKDDPAAGGQGRSHIGKMLLIGAVELSPDGEPRRVRLEPLTDFTATSIGAFVARVVEPGAMVLSDGLASYRSLKDHRHRAKVVGNMAAHVVLPWIHRVFANFKRWELGAYHGIRKAHLRRYLDEFVFRWNRRQHVGAAFDTLLGLTARLGHASYGDLVGQRA